MTEIKKIQRGLAQDGRQAYEETKSNNNAFILIGNSIYRIGADGSREMVNFAKHEGEGKEKEIHHLNRVVVWQL